jgi:hypothetical protein
MASMKTGKMDRNLLWTVSAYQICGFNTVYFCSIFFVYGLNKKKNSPIPTPRIMTAGASTKIEQGTLYHQLG